MNKKELRKLAKVINNGQHIEIVFIFAPPDYFCFQSNTNTIEISSFFHQLSKNDIFVYLTHEIGHLNTISDIQSLFISDYAAEYAANKWAINRLDQLQYNSALVAYIEYLKDLANIEILEEFDEEYKEAAGDLLQNLKLL